MVKMSPEATDICFLTGCMVSSRLLYLLINRSSTSFSDCIIELQQAAQCDLRKSTTTVMQKTTHCGLGRKLST